MATSRQAVVAESILTIIRTVKVAAQPALTTSEEYFNQAGVVWMGKNFRAQFLGLEVPAVDEAELTVWKLEQPSLDDSIIAELGGKDKAEISVSQFCAFLGDRGDRESPERFIFYLKGKDGNLLTVRAYWIVGRVGCRAGAYSINSQGGWCEGDQVLSR